MNKKLTPMQELFCLEYLKDLNGSAAAIRAGFSEADSRAGACKLLKKPEIKRRIQEAMDRRARRLEISADNVLSELLNIAMVDIGEIYDSEGFILPMKDIPERVRRAIAGVEVTTMFAEGVDIGEKRKVKLSDKIRALELLGKHLSLFADRIKYFINGEEMTPERVLEEYAKVVSKAPKVK